MTDIRVTQDAVETLSQPTPAVAVTQYAVEVLGTVGAAVTDIRVSQDAIEVLSSPIPTARMTQYLVEMLGSSAPAVVPSAETTQLSIIG